MNWMPSTGLTTWKRASGEFMKARSGEPWSRSPLPLKGSGSGGSAAIDSTACSDAFLKRMNLLLAGFVGYIVPIAHIAHALVGLERHWLRRLARKFVPVLEEKLPICIERCLCAYVMKYH